MADATWMETRAVLDHASNEWVIDGRKMWMSGAHRAPYAFIFARSNADGSPPREGGKADGITCFCVPMATRGVVVEEYLWTFNMPTDQAAVTLSGVRIPNNEFAILGEAGRGLALAQHFVFENRIRQAASGVGVAQYCIEESVRFAQARQPFGSPIQLENVATGFLSVPDKCPGA